MIGIDAISLYTPRYMLKLEELARARGIDPLKYSVGLGQNAMSIMPPAEDIITMAASAALPLIQNRKQPSLLLFATESGIDHSKSAGIWVHKLLNLPSSCRVLELKQACYSATGALQLAIPYVKAYPNEEVLIIASDNARYGIGTPGEPTQGCGAAAFIVKANPNLLAIEEGSGLFTDHVMDFWRPNQLDTALVDGKYSAKIYLTALDACWKEYAVKTGRSFEDHTRFCYHLPFSKMAEKAHERLSKHASSPELVAHSLHYTKAVGNSYSAALYFGIASLLENDEEDLSQKRIGLFSYGSGCVAEFFSGVVQPNYKKALRKEAHTSLLSNRCELSCQEYERYFLECGNQNSELFNPSECQTGAFRLASIQKYVRHYQPLGCSV